MLEAWAEAGRLGSADDQEERDSTERITAGSLWLSWAAVTQSHRLVRTREAYSLGLLEAEEGPFRASPPASGIGQHPWRLSAYRRTTPILASVPRGVPVSCKDAGYCIRATPLQ